MLWKFKHEEDIQFYKYQLKCQLPRVENVCDFIQTKNIQLFLIIDWINMLRRKENLEFQINGKTFVIQEIYETLSPLNVNEFFCS